MSCKYTYRGYACKHTHTYIYRDKQENKVNMATLSSTHTQLVDQAIFTGRVLEVHSGTFNVHGAEGAEGGSTTSFGMAEGKGKDVDRANCKVCPLPTAPLQTLTTCTPRQHASCCWCSVLFAAVETTGCRLLA